MNGATTLLVSNTLLRPLLAEVDSYRHLGRHFQQGATPFRTGDLVLAAVMIIGPVALIVVLACLQRFLRNRQRYSARGLFTELCRAHGLPWRSRRRLWRIARRLQLDPPALLFLEPERLEPEHLEAAGVTVGTDELCLERQVLLGASAPHSLDLTVQP